MSNCHCLRGMTTQSLGEGHQVELQLRGHWTPDVVTVFLPVFVGHPDLFHPQVVDCNGQITDMSKLKYYIQQL